MPFPRKNTLSKIVGFYFHDTRVYEIIARKINNFFRSIRLYFSGFKEKSKNPGYSGWGNFLYINLEDTDQKLWKPFGFDNAIAKIKKNSKEISMLAKSINADFYIIIYPWPDTLEYGQKIFNWEEFAGNLCETVSCTKLINLFPDFRYCLLYTSPSPRD